MTGTLADGYANGLYYLLWRLNPTKFKEQKFYHDEESRSRFQMEYGFWEKIVKTRGSVYGKTSKARNTRTQVKLLPGYTINTFPEWLLETTVFLKLSDVAPHLPPKHEFVNVVEMDEELRKVTKRSRTAYWQVSKKAAANGFHNAAYLPELSDLLTAPMRLMW